VTCAPKQVIYAARHEWALYADDIIARRTRLAFLNKNAALQAIPRVVDLMAGELGWDEDRQREETRRCLEYMRHFGGPTPAARDGPTARVATVDDIREAFAKVDVKHAGLIDAMGAQLVAEVRLLRDAPGP
jgi:glycerol-3-phosphate dehydrogenase